MVRCQKCDQSAVIEIRRHNVAYCAPCFLSNFEQQVARIIEKKKMFGRDELVLVAVSGGKDSLALWDLLLRLGYRAIGLHIDLGIGAYSAHSRRQTEAFAAERHAELVVVDLAARYGLGIDEMARRSRRRSCSACGLTKRHLFNAVACEMGVAAVATGHNLDDEVATLFGNVMHWQTGYLAHQSPVLPSTHPKLVRKVKPLYRVSERETAGYALLRGIDYVLEECPNAQGARSLVYKGVLNTLEVNAPGSKHQFLLGFLDKVRPIFAAAEEVTLRDCSGCGQPTTAPVCAFCRMLVKVEGQR